jgi:Arc/MetJ-type ribon-helix-helix transcriptional regulator
MGSKSISLPEGLEKQINERIEEKKDYQNFSEFVREALRDKLREETELYPIEIQRLIKQGEEPEGKTIEEIKDKLNIE